MDALPLARAQISTVLNELVEGTDLDLKLDAAFQNLVRILKSRQEFGNISGKHAHTPPKNHGPVHCVDHGVNFGQADSRRCVVVWW